MPLYRRLYRCLLQVDSELHRHLGVLRYAYLKAKHGVLTMLGVNRFSASVAYSGDVAMDDAALALYFAKATDADEALSAAAAARAAARARGRSASNGGGDSSLSSSRSAAAGTRGGSSPVDPAGPVRRDTMTSPAFRAGYEHRQPGAGASDAEGESGTSDAGTGGTGDTRGTQAGAGPAGGGASSAADATGGSSASPAAQHGLCLPQRQLGGGGSGMSSAAGVGTADSAAGSDAGPRQLRQTRPRPHDRADTAAGVDGVDSEARQQNQQQQQQPGTRRSGAHDPARVAVLRVSGSALGAFLGGDETRAAVRDAMASLPAAPLKRGGGRMLGRDSMVDAQFAAVLREAARDGDLSNGADGRPPHLSRDYVGRFGDRQVAGANTAGTGPPDHGAPLATAGGGVVTASVPHEYAGGPIASGDPLTDEPALAKGGSSAAATAASGSGEPPAGARTGPGHAFRSSGGPGSDSSTAIGGSSSGGSGGVIGDHAAGGGVGIVNAVMPTARVVEAIQSYERAEAEARQVEEYEALMRAATGRGYTAVPQQQQQQQPEYDLQQQHQVMVASTFEPADHHDATGFDQGAQISSGSDSKAAPALRAGTLGENTGHWQPVPRLGDQVGQPGSRLQVQPSLQLPYGHSSDAGFAMAAIGASLGTPHTPGPQGMTVTSSRFVGPRLGLRGSLGYGMGTPRRLNEPFTPNRLLTPQQQGPTTRSFLQASGQSQPAQAGGGGAIAHFAAQVLLERPEAALAARLQEQRMDADITEIGVHPQPQPQLPPQARLQPQLEAPQFGRPGSGAGAASPLVGAGPASMPPLDPKVLAPVKDTRHAGLSRGRTAPELASSSTGVNAQPQLQGLMPEATRTRKTIHVPRVPSGGVPVMLPDEAAFFLRRNHHQHHHDEASSDAPRVALEGHSDRERQDQPPLLRGQSAPAMYAYASTINGQAVAAGADSAYFSAADHGRSAPAPAVAAAAGALTPSELEKAQATIGSVAGSEYLLPRPMPMPMPVELNLGAQAARPLPTAFARAGAASPSSGSGSGQPVLAPIGEHCDLRLPSFATGTSSLDADSEAQAAYTRTGGRPSRSSLLEGLRAAEQHDDAVGEDVDLESAPSRGVSGMSGVSSFSDADVNGDTADSSHGGGSVVATRRLAPPQSASGLQRDSAAAVTDSKSTVRKQTSVIIHDPQANHDHHDDGEAARPVLRSVQQVRSRPEDEAEGCGADSESASASGSMNDAASAGATNFTGSVATAATEQVESEYGGSGIRATSGRLAGQPAMAAVPVILSGEHDAKRIRPNGGFGRLDLCKAGCTVCRQQGHLRYVGSQTTAIRFTAPRSLVSAGGPGGSSVGPGSSSVGAARSVYRDGASSSLDSAPSPRQRYGDASAGEREGEEGGASVTYHTQQQQQQQQVHWQAPQQLEEQVRRQQAQQSRAGGFAPAAQNSLERLHSPAHDHGAVSETQYRDQGVMIPPRRPAGVPASAATLALAATQVDASGLDDLPLGSITAEQLAALDTAVTVVLAHDHDEPVAAAAAVGVAATGGSTAATDVTAPRAGAPSQDPGAGTVQGSGSSSVSAAGGHARRPSLLQRTGSLVRGTLSKGSSSSVGRGRAGSASHRSIGDRMTTVAIDGAGGYVYPSASGATLAAASSGHVTAQYHDDVVAHGRSAGWVSDHHDHGATAVLPDSGLQHCGDSGSAASESESRSAAELALRRERTAAGPPLLATVTDNNIRHDHHDGQYSRYNGGQPSADVTASRADAAASGQKYATVGGAGQALAAAALTRDEAQALTQPQPQAARLRVSSGVLAGSGTSSHDSDGHYSANAERVISVGDAGPGRAWATPMPRVCKQQLKRATQAQSQAAAASAAVADTVSVTPSARAEAKPSGAQPQEVVASAQRDACADRTNDYTGIAAAPTGSQTAEPAGPAGPVASVASATSAPTLAPTPRSAESGRPGAYSNESVSGQDAVSLSLPMPPPTPLLAPQPASEPEVPADMTARDYAAVCVDCLGIGGAAPLVAAPSDVLVAASNAPISATTSWPGKLRGFFRRQSRGRSGGVATGGAVATAPSDQAALAEPLLGGSEPGAAIAEPPTETAGRAGRNHRDDHRHDAPPQRRAASAAPAADRAGYPLAGTRGSGGQASQASRASRSRSLSAAISRRRHGVAPAPPGADVGYSSRGFEKRRISGEFLTVGLVNIGPDAEVSTTRPLRLPTWNRITHADCRLQIAMSSRRRTGSRCTVTAHYHDLVACCTT